MKSLFYKFPFLYAVIYLPLSYRSICEFNWHFQQARQFNSTTILDKIFDKIIPFHAFFLLFYLSYFVFMLMPLFFKRKDQISVLINILMISTIAHALFLIFPSSVERYDLSLSHFNYFELKILKLIYEFDINSNCFPTLHAGHVLLISAMFKDIFQNKYTIILFQFWAFSIAISTIVLHQHSVIDVIAASILAAFVYKYSDRIQKLLLNSFNGKINRLDSNL